jgi:hypothetical protein
VYDLELALESEGEGLEGRGDAGSRFIEKIAVVERAKGSLLMSVGQN